MLARVVLLVVATGALAGCAAPDGGLQAVGEPVDFRITTTYDESLRRAPYTDDTHTATRLPGGAQAVGQLLSVRVTDAIGGADDWEGDEPCTRGTLDQMADRSTQTDCGDLAERDVIELPGPSDDLLTYPLGGDGIIRLSAPTGIVLWIQPTEAYSEKMRSLQADPDACASPHTPMGARDGFTTVGDIREEGESVTITGQGNIAIQYFGFCDTSVN